MAELDHAPVSTNGTAPHLDDRELALASLRSEPDNVHLFRGFAPLIVGAILFILMITLAPSVAPERVIEQPVSETTTTTTSTTTTTIEVAP